MFPHHLLGAGLLGLALTTSACGGAADAAPTGDHQVGVLLVNHGSHSPRWRQTLLDLEDEVRDDLLAHPRIDGVRTAFMEYTEPSIATQLEAFDTDGFDEILIVPILLTVSSHSFDDIPVIIGTKDDVATADGLASEGIATYTPRAEVSIAPLLDFAQVLRENLKRRVAALSTGSESEGVVLVAYGSAPFDEEWTLFMEDLGEQLSDDLGIDTIEHAWCGHLVSYSPEPTAEAIERVLATEDHALVVPVLVAVDEDFQYSMILEAAERDYAGGEVHYVPDSILPEPLVQDWAVDISKELAEL